MSESTAVGRARTSEPPPLAIASLTPAAFHDGHGDDLSRCDAWVYACGKTDPHGGSWETTNRAGQPVEPTTAEWIGYVTCTACGRVFDRDGLAVRGPEELSV
ncbi:MAG: hypothetical protein ACRDGT_07420 [Candidatus Limnocylindria bacterium]